MGTSKPFLQTSENVLTCMSDPLHSTTCSAALKEATLSARGDESTDETVLTTTLVGRRYGLEYGLVTVK